MARDSVSWLWLIFSTLLMIIILEWQSHWNYTLRVFSAHTTCPVITVSANICNVSMVKICALFEVHSSLYLVTNFCIFLFLLYSIFHSRSAYIIGEDDCSPGH